MDLQEFDERYCSSLNEQQREAVHTVEGAILLLAVPGSGKTTVLVTRLGYMVCCRNIRPENILTMTYTVAATAEMRQRFSALFGARYAAAMEFSTINSVSDHIIRFYAARRGSGKPFQVVENRDAAAIVGEIYRNVSGEYATESTILDIRTGITYVKNMMLTPEEIEKTDLGIKDFPRIYEDYQTVMRRSRLMDFDDQMIYAMEILNRYPDILAHFQDRFPYICVDESQDTSKIQHEIIRLLAQKHGNLFMVGDEDQSIYGFRAAYPDALLRFEQDHPDAKILLMERNYRSTPEIVNVANTFISRNRMRHPKVLTATRESGEPIRVVHTAGRADGFAFLTEMAKTCPPDTAILYRNNDSALPLIDMFERMGIPYNCRKFEDGFFTHRIVADVRDIILFSSDLRNEELFMGLFYKFGSPISRAAAEYACARSRESGKTIPEELARCPELDDRCRETALNLVMTLPEIPEVSAETAIVRIFRGLHYGSYVLANNLDPGKFDILRLLAAREQTPADFLNRLDVLQNHIRNHINVPGTALTLSTVHSSKGLEYTRVYLLDMFDGQLPYKTREELKTEADHRTYEEERRLYYVAMTRAKDVLYLMCSESAPAEFHREIMDAMPRILEDAGDVFGTLRGNFCGKSYTHAEKGKGIIRACCDDRVLVQYAGGERELSTLGAMLENRDRTVRYAPSAPVGKLEPAPAPAEEIRKVIPGVRMIHTKYGGGTVVSVRNGIAEIRFSADGQSRSFLLKTSLENGMLQFA